MKGKAFKPTGTPLYELEHILLHQDELEAIRLCDLEGLFQEQAGEKMGGVSGYCAAPAGLGQKKGSGGTGRRCCYYL